MLSRLKQVLRNERVQYWGYRVLATILIVVGVAILAYVSQVIEK